MSVLQRDSQLLGSIAQRRHRLLSVRPLVHCCRVTKESGLGVCRSGRLQESRRIHFPLRQESLALQTGLAAWLLDDTIRWVLIAAAAESDLL